MDYKDFEAMLRSDEAKAAEYKRALESAKENGAKSDSEALSMAAAAVGADLAPEQVEQFFAGCLEVNDDDLEFVAGGAQGNPLEACVLVDYCFTVLIHDSDNDSKQMPCWNDYTCIAVNN